ncbi:MAG: endopeptidase La [Polyangiales bacterium]
MSERQTLPVIPLRGTVVFPGVTVPIAVGRESTLRAVEAANKGDRRVFAVAQRENVDKPEPGQLYTMGVIAKIGQVTRTQGGVQLILEGEARASAIDYRASDDFMRAVCIEVADVPPPDAEDPAFVALNAELRSRAAALAQKRGVPEPVLARIMQALTEPGAFADLAAGYLDVPAGEKQALLELTVLEERMRRVLIQIQRMLDQLEAREDIQSQVQQELGERQRELFLREQLKAIKRELGEGEGQGEDDAARLRERLEKLDLPEEARTEVNRELGRLERAGRESAEGQVIRTYLEWIAEMPWSARTEDQLDVTRAAQVLDDDHYGLEDVKDRVLEFLAVRQLHAAKVKREAQSAAVPLAEAALPAQAGAEPTAAPGAAQARETAKGPILLFIGPPGVGKTSIGKSIARALGRKYVRLALGGVRDEADVRGHRRTYIGAMPGRIAQALKQAGTKNPVMLLDEVDKLGVSYQGNPSAALLEVLDPAQNNSFTDHYLNVPFDLSEVLFIATANFVEGIPAPLFDRMEVVEFAGYTEREKREIAKKYLIPRQLSEAGLTQQKIELGDDAVALIVSRYTREAGVRQLERKIGAVTRKLARKVAAGETIAARVGPDEVQAMLGRPRVRPEKAAEQNEVGVATGMYYTPAGGDIMFVEASIRRLPEVRRPDAAVQVQGFGSVSLILTGQLGDVMKESARAALTYAATHVAAFDMSEDRLGSIEAHIHVPAGAVPKDGPSAGVAMATALASAMTGRKVRREVAMTGEITLRGHVLPIGGLKEKVLGAHRAGIEHIILPAENEADLDDLPSEVRDDLRFSLVRSLEEVLDLALLEPDRGPDVSHEAIAPSVQPH